MKRGVTVPLHKVFPAVSSRLTGGGVFHRIAAWALTAAVFGALLIASALVTLDGRPTEFIRLGEALFLSLCIWLVLLAATRRVWVALALALPAVLLVPMEIWFRLQFGAPSSAQSVALVLETTWGEAANFLITYGGRLAGWWAAWFLLYAAALWCAWCTRIGWRHGSYAWCLLLLPAVLVIVYFGSGAQPWLSQTESNDPFDGKASEGWSQQWEDVFPVNLVIAVQQYELEKKKIWQTQRALQSQSLHGALTDPASAPEVVVLVIGESATATRWSLLGYPRQTTPRLQGESNLVAFTDTVGLSVSTRTAVPGVLSRRPVLRPDGYVDAQAEPSLIKAFGEAGYQTHWYSNQSPFGKFDTSIAVYAREAQNVRFLNPSTYESRGNLDAVLLAPLAAALNTPGRHLIVLHTLGSHFDYTLRYPPAYDKFQPSTKNSSLPDASPEALLERIGNSYDNSVLYTDYFLSEIISLLKGSKKSSLVSYFSDHGVDLPGNACRYREAARASESSYRVPALFWFSESFRKTHQDDWRKLDEHKNLPYTTRAVFATLLELAGINISDGLPEESFLKTNTLKNHPRLVGVGNQYIDFDEARSRNSCFISTNR